MCRLDADCSVSAQARLVFLHCVVVVVVAVVVEVAGTRVALKGRATAMLRSAKWRQGEVEQNPYISAPTFTNQL